MADSSLWEICSCGLKYAIVPLFLAGLFIFLFFRLRAHRRLNRKLREAVDKSLKAEQAAEQAMRLKSQFLSNVSHEVRTPVNGLVGMASLLEELITDPVQRKYLDTIRVCSRKLMVLMNDLIDFGRIENDGLELKPEVFEISETLHYCEEVIGRAAEKKGLAFSIVRDGLLPDRLVADSTRLGQVLINLLNNAVKYTEQGSVIFRISYEPMLGHTGILHCSIEDTGIGIEEKSQSILFEPFSQVHGDSQSSGGSGLGLAISKKLVELMGGSLTVQSVFGEGSTFFMRIPVHLPKENGQ